MTAIVRIVHAVRDFLGWILFEAHIEPLEVWSAVNGLLWGLWVLNPFVDIFSTADGYRTMAALPEWLWGACATLSSLAQLVGRVRGDPSWQRAGARTLAALWMFAGGSLAWVNWRWPATITYPMLALASLLVSYRAESYPLRQAESPLVPDGGDDGST